MVTVASRLVTSALEAALCSEPHPPLTHHGRVPRSAGLPLRRKDRVGDELEAHQEPKVPCPTCCRRRDTVLQPMRDPPSLLGGQ